MATSGNLLQSSKQSIARISTDCRSCWAEPARYAYSRSTPGALPLATTFNCKFVAKTTSQSSSEPLCCQALPVLLLPMALLTPMTRQLLASPVSADIIKNIFVLDQVCHVSATKCTAFKFRRASRVQAGQQGAGGLTRRWQEQSSCTSYVLKRASIFLHVPSQSGQKISCKRIYKHALSIY